MVYALLGLVLTLSSVLPAQQAEPSGQQRKEAPAGIQQTPNDLRPEAPGGDVVGALADPKSFRIGPEDVIAVLVWKEPELSGQFAVRPDGKITLNLVGEVEVAGMTPMEVQQKLTGEFGKVLNNPVVSVQMRAIRSSKYYITGNVGRTGMFPLVVKTTVLEALTLAGGLGEWANKKKIVILRGKERLFFNYTEVIKGKKLEQNIDVQNGDFIIVD
ncbi:MAG: polysaccharide biosynthesis/export family protein [Acidobacteria bacterium]|nr:polysaccharide biosynthesis/export family protein [Acidobacteriota bacterium]